MRGTSASANEMRGLVPTTVFCCPPSAEEGGKLLQDNFCLQRDVLKCTRRDVTPIYLFQHVTGFKILLPKGWSVS